MRFTKTGMGLYVAAVLAVGIACAFEVKAADWHEVRVDRVGSECSRRDPDDVIRAAYAMGLEPRIKYQPTADNPWMITVSAYSPAGEIIWPFFSSRHLCESFVLIHRANF